MCLLVFLRSNIRIFWKQNQKYERDLLRSLYKSANMDDIYFLNQALKKKTYKTHIEEKKNPEKQTSSL